MQKKPRLAFVTDSEHPDLPPDDRAVFPFLAEKADCEIVDWQAQNIDWQRFDLVVVRATWDYPEKVAAFRRWLQKMQADGVRLQNSAATIAANLDKNYLLDLEQKGVRTVETEWLRAGDAANFRAIFDRKGWPKAVAKPAVSVNSNNTWIVEPSNFDSSRARAEELLAAGAEILVQPFLPEILGEGEWSMLFFNGNYSHSILKRPKTGDFRVQYTHGGSIHLARPRAKMIETAQKILQKLPETPLYARVDGVRRGADFLLIELEMIEPVLYIGFADGAPERWATAILERAAAAF